LRNDFVSKRACGYVATANQSWPLTASSPCALPVLALATSMTTTALLAARSDPSKRTFAVNFSNDPSNGLPP
jgi:hypothetical protein